MSVYYVVGRVGDRTYRRRYFATERLAPRRLGLHEDGSADWHRGAMVHHPSGHAERHTDAGTCGAPEHQDPFGRLVV